MATLDIDATTVTGPWFRHTPAGIDPTTRPKPPGDNRWQRGDEIDALYLADSVTCAWAEWYRHLAEAGVPPTMAMPRDLWRYHLEPLRVADLSDTNRLVRVGLPEPRPGRRSWGSFQAIGARLHDEGWAGLLAPSAARPTSTVLVVLLTNETPEGVTAVERTRVTQPPAPPTGMQT